MHGIRCSTFSPSPLWGEGRGEGISAHETPHQPGNARKPLCTVSDAARFSPSPLWGEGRGEGISAHETPHQPGNARKPLCTVSDAARFSPSPLWGEGRGEGAARTMPHTSPAMQENHYARYQMQHVFPPRPFGESAGVRGQRARDPTSARQCKKTIMHGIKCSTFFPLAPLGRGSG